MTSRIQSRKTLFSIWFLGVSFVLYQFFMQLSSGVIIEAILKETPFSAFTAGLLGSSLYIVYTSLQIPVGLLFDRKNTKNLFSGSAFLCAMGCFVFAASHSLPALCFGRVLIGGGSAFAFVGFSHVLRQYFPLRQFAFLIGSSETLAFIAIVIGMMSMGSLLAYLGWRQFTNIIGCIGLLISLGCWLIIPAKPTKINKSQSYRQQILPILKNSKAWLNGLYVGLSFALITVFGALWSIPFLQAKLSCSLSQASCLDAMFFLGSGLSCPLFGYLSSRCKKRRPLMRISSLSSAALFLLVLFLPTQSALIIGLLLFLTGSCCGAYMLSYTIANEIAPANALSTSTGFANTLALVSAPILQPSIGYLLDVIGQADNYSLADFEIVLLIIPAALILAAYIVNFLPEKQEDKSSDPQMDSIETEKLLQPSPK